MRGTAVMVRTSDGEAYPVVVGAGVVEELPALLASRASAHRYAVISDANVARIHGERVLTLLADAGREADLMSFPAGEESKTRQEWFRLTDALFAAGLGRDGCVVALGGGVTGDLAGFVAATFLRGVPVVQIPTSLVAMVDSSVGGKTGVDVPVGKNLVGAFHPPRFVLADPELAGTLPPEERAQGLVEAVKHGAIRDAGYLERLEEDTPALLEGDVDCTVRAVHRSVEIKAEVVSRDEREGGLRQILNFGHTLGHALETLSGYRLPHGTAVGLGMVLEARLGEEVGVTPSGVADRIQGAVEGLGLPARISRLPSHLAGILSSPEAILQGTRRDKKARGGVVRYVLLRGLGEADPGEGWSRPVEEETVRAFLHREVGS